MFKVLDDSRHESGMGGVGLAMKNKSLLIEAAKYEHHGNVLIKP